MSANTSAATLWITGTGTGVGKTVLTALLTVHLRGRGIRALAMKPFCSGGREDLELLEGANDGELTGDHLNPVYCDEPVAPIAGLPVGERERALDRAKAGIDRNRERCDLLLIEGAGGVAVPVTASYTIGHLIAEKGDQQLLVGSNRLGIINEILLSHRYLYELTGKESPVILMENYERDASSESNGRILKEVLGHERLAPLEDLGPRVGTIADIRSHQKKLIKTLDQIVDWIKVSPAERDRAKSVGSNSGKQRIGEVKTSKKSFDIERGRN